jgi:hypothetical protein
MYYVLYICIWRYGGENNCSDNYGDEYEMNEVYYEGRLYKNIQNYYKV